MKKTTIKNSKYESKWGVIILIPGILLLWLGYWLSGFLPDRLNASLIENFFLYTEIIGGTGAIMVGYFSYPRIHNLKVFLAAHLTGLSSLIFLLMENLKLFPAKVPSNLIPGLYLIMLTGIFTSTLMPTFLKYRWTKRITAAAVFTEIATVYLLCETSFLPTSLETLRKASFSQWETLLPATLTFLSILFSILLLKNQFFLGGVFAGMASILGGGWYLGILSPAPTFYDFYIFSAAPLFLVAGISIHWLTRMEHKASYDPLLRIYNRSHCEMILDEHTRIDTSPPFGLVIIDIDRFKRVNDRYGHRAGDEVLIQVARILTKELVPDGIVCRYGGEEFVVFFPHKKSRRIKKIMDRARKKIQKSVIRSGKKRIKVTVSIGISHRSRSSQTLHEVFSTADKALYRAKKGGRNQVRFSKSK